MKRFADRMAIVTGATSGIGRATAAAFALEGATVVLAGRRERESRDAVRGIHDAGGTATFVKTDVTVESEVEALIQSAIDAYGQVDLAFNNAGVGETSHDVTHTKSAEDYHRIMNTNVLGVFLSLKHELRTMIGSGFGAIVNNASVTGLVGFPGSALYAASKHAVIGLTKAAALEYATKGIRVNAIAPGGTETPLLDRITGGLRSESHRRFAQTYHPMARTARPDEIANAVLWLCSEESSFVTGHTMVVDGGWTAQ
jgi:NAD(P)-dependent dehydrogenase (short-subunit alcohol dehydrogenase family)